MYKLLLPFFYITSLVLNGQDYNIYRNGQTIITGAWNSQGTLTETSDFSPFDGNEHYRFEYNYTDYWAGFGLNMNNWGVSSAVDFSGFQFLNIAYRGSSVGNQISISLRSFNDFGTTYTLGEASANYTHVQIPLSLLAGSINLSEVTEINISITGSDMTGSGIVFVDAIYLSTGTTNPIGSESWNLLRSLGKGFNLSNWLEAYWLMPFNAFPEVSVYTREHFALMSNLGFSHVRCPVTFERLAGPGPDYTINFDQVTFDLLDSTITWCQDYGLKLIITNHHGFDITNQNYTASTERLIAIWTQIMQQYGHLDPGSTLFELYNEAISVSNSNLKLVFEAILSSIRPSYPNHTFIIGANGYNSGQGLITFNPVDDPRIIYTFHNYDPYFFTHQGMSWTNPPYFSPRSFPIDNEVAEIRSLFRSVAAWSDAFDLPVYLGEFGVAISADETSRCNYIELLTHLSDSLEMPYAYWGAFQGTDGFGFIPGGAADINQLIPCFAVAMELNTTVLSVNWVSQKFTCTQNELIISWHLDGDIDKNTILLKHSKDGMLWQPIDIILHQANESKISASVSHQNGPYFRLEGFLYSGDLVLSPLIYASCPHAQPIEIYPNPTTGELFIQLEDLAFGRKLQLSYLDMFGRTVLIDRWFHESVVRSCSVSNLSSGVYSMILEDITSGTLLKVQKIVVTQEQKP